MKSLLIFFVAIMFTGGTFAQSSSYQVLQDKFKGEPEVYSFSVSGWVGRAVLKLAGEQEFTHAIKEVKHVRLISIPKKEFAA